MEVFLLLDVSCQNLEEYKINSRCILEALNPYTSQALNPVSPLL